MNEFRTLRVDESGNNNSRSKGLELGSERDPSFSGWCDDDGLVHATRLDKEGVSQEDFDFRLAVVQKNEPKYWNFNNGKYHSTNVLKRMDLSGDIDDEPAATGYEPLMINKGHTRSTDGFSPMNFQSSVERHVENPNPSTLTDVLKTLLLILVWYTVSTLLTLYNKTLLGNHMGKFPAPLLMNAIHFAMQAALSVAITWLWSDGFHSSVMSWSDYFYRVVPMALSTALDIDLSNESLVFITVTFATMCKSASPIFLLLFAFAFRLETPSAKLLGIIFIISAGILLTAAKETDFEFWGFLFVMLSAVMSGFRWTMTQILLQKEAYGLKNPLTLMSYVAPVMMIATAVLSLFLDPWDEFKTSNYFNSSWHIVRSFLLMSFGGTLAFFMVLAEYILVSLTSAITVTVAGVVKEVITILVAVVYFHDEFTWLKGVGLLITIGGVSLFNWYKYQKLLEVPPTDGATYKYTIIDQADEEEDGT